MFNAILGCIHAFVIIAITLCCIKKDIILATSWLTILLIFMNIFISKQIQVGVLHITATDSLAIGFMVGMTLIREFYGKKTAYTMIRNYLLVSIAIIVLTGFHLCYIPSKFDNSHEHYISILNPSIRVIAASICTFFIVQILDIMLFTWLKKILLKQLTIRVFISVLVSQVVDTVMFSLLGLYGLVHNILDIIIVSIAIKLLIIVLSSPLIYIFKNYISYRTDESKI